MYTHMLPNISWSPWYNTLKRIKDTCAISNWSRGPLSFKASATTPQKPRREGNGKLLAKIPMKLSQKNVANAQAQMGHCRSQLKHLIPANTHTHTTLAQTYMHSHTYALTHIHTHALTHVHTHMLSHTHTHTLTQMHKKGKAHSVGAVHLYAHKSNCTVNNTRLQS